MSKKSIFKIILLVAFTVLLVISSYAWFQDKSNPQISVSDIKVSAAEGLVIKLDPDSAGRKTVDLNSVLDSFDEFELKQVSSFNPSSKTKKESDVLKAQIKKEIAKVRTTKVKPGYKKKRKYQVEQVVKKQKRAMIREDIKRQKKERARQAQIAKRMEEDNDNW